MLDLSPLTKVLPTVFSSQIGTRAFRWPAHKPVTTHASRAKAHNKLHSGVHFHILLWIESVSGCITDLTFDCHRENVTRPETWDDSKRQPVLDSVFLIFWAGKSLEQKMGLAVMWLLTNLFLSWKQGEKARGGGVSVMQSKECILCFK